jgi:hypothetical protein
MKQLAGLQGSRAVLVADRLDGPPIQVMAQGPLPGAVKGFEARLHEQG